MNIQLIIFYVISNMECNGANVGCFRQKFPLCATFTMFTAILKYDHSYKIVQFYASLCNHIIWMKQLNKED